MNMNNIPWVEKYRPSNFKDIVLDPMNRTMFENILKFDYFPNLLFYGPPGTGKTTTVINLINEYQIMYYGKINRANVIHLNASDERGIDIIRNQIYQFVRSMNLLNHRRRAEANEGDETISSAPNLYTELPAAKDIEMNMKFVILDEVDYMTKNAQQALKYILQAAIYNVRFCLICNYITKIDESLKNEFICIRFNQLPKEIVYQFLQNILQKEHIHISESTIRKIMNIYNSDIRSMINFIQMSASTMEYQQKQGHLDVGDGAAGGVEIDKYVYILNDEIFQIIDSFLFADIHRCENRKDHRGTLMKSPERMEASEGNESMFLDAMHRGTSIRASMDMNAKHRLTLQEYVHEISIQYNIDKRSIMIKYFNYLIRNFISENRSSQDYTQLLDRIKDIIHCDHIDINVFLRDSTPM